MKNICLILVLCCLSFTVSGKDRKQPKGKQIDCQLISSRDAIKKAKKKTKGKVVSVKLNKRGNKSVYRVRVLVGEKRIKNITIKACK